MWGQLDEDGVRVQLNPTKERTPKQDHRSVDHNGRWCFT